MASIHQIRRLLSASWRARRIVPSVSAIFRLAASSLLIVSRFDRTFAASTIGSIVTTGASGVFMYLMLIILSGKNESERRADVRSGKLGTATKLISLRSRPAVLNQNRSCRVADQKHSVGLQLILGDLLFNDRVVNASRRILQSKVEIASAE
ncbi:MULTISPECIES: hypothetical protein [unclassified Mesorhizobium]|uniref:hypothetical protein n=1 Tax=unclassified Mesorhizobium TaxID=325217 RepID=UPI0013E2A0A1|nr:MULTISPECIES: hypothetical protein [unclassified Mesorhizobium]